MSNEIFQTVTVTLNPAIDRTVTIRNFTPGEVNRGDDVRSSPGGKGVNVASALADYGHSVAVTGFLGRENCSVFEDLFDRKDIADHFVRIAGQTRVAIKIIDPAKLETTDINLPGPAPSEENLTSLRGHLDELAELDEACFVLSGSVPPGVDLEIYSELIAKLRARGQRVVLDTSGEAFLRGIKAAPHVVKPNLRELEDFAGTKLKERGEIVKAAREILTLGVELAAISLGAEGALFVTRDSVVSARPPDVAVRSTVGAGDAMVAGIVAAMIRDLPLTDCARLASAFALVWLTRGEAGIRANGAIEAAMQEITVQ